MRRLSGRRSRKAGLAPGTLVYVGERPVSGFQITAVNYTEGWVEERGSGKLDEALRSKRKPRVRWLNLKGVPDQALLERFGKLYGIHPLVLEDILHTGQRPKIEDYGDYLFLVLRLLHYDGRRGTVEEEQVSIVLGEGIVFSFQEGAAGDLFEPIRTRIREKKGMIRSRGADYLAYCLIDAIVDQYFTVLEALEDRIEEVEKELLDRGGRSTLHDIYRLKREVLLVRRSVWPLREVVHQMERGDHPLFRKEIVLYLRDLYDHTIAVIDALENEREVLAAMLETYLSNVSNRMNEVMKVLTVIATIFIPLSFIAGIYGMNFDRTVSPWNMPELGWYWGYPAVLLSMAAVAAFMVLYFKRKKWF